MIQGFMADTWPDGMECTANVVWLAGVVLEYVVWIESLRDIVYWSGGEMIGSRCVVSVDCVSS